MPHVPLQPGDVCRAGKPFQVCGHRGNASRFGARRCRSGVHDLPPGHGIPASRRSDEGRLRNVPSRAGKTARRLATRPSCFPRRSPGAKLYRLPRYAQRASRPRPTVTNKGDEHPVVVRRMSPRGIARIPDAHHPAGFDSSELLTLDPRDRPIQAGVDGDGGLHVMPHVAQYPATHKPAVEH